MTSHRCWKSLLMLLTWSAILLAAPFALAAQYGIEDLSNRNIDVSGDLPAADKDKGADAFTLLTLKMGDPAAEVTCEPVALQLNKGHLMPDLGIAAPTKLAKKCDRFWYQEGTKAFATFKATFTRKAGGTLELALTVKAESKLEQDVEGAAFKRKAGSQVLTADGYVLDDKLFSFTPELGWNSVVVNPEGTLKLANEYTGDITTISVAKKAGSVYKVRTTKVTTEPATPSPAPVVNSPENPPAVVTPAEPVFDADDPLPPGTSLTPKLDPFFDVCRAPPGFEDSFLVCADVLYDDRGQPRITGLPGGHVLRPNRSILVMVRHSDRVGVTVSTTGTRGIYQPPIKNESGIALHSDSGTPATTVARKSIVSIHSFAPRLPGNVDVKIQTTQVDAVDHTTKPIADTTVELIVDTTYGGVFRMGFGLVMGDAVDRSFAARKAPRSGQSEIIATNSGALDIELVLGFAPFLDYFRGGRSYTDQWNLTHFPFGFSPYVGLGVLSVSETGVDGFKSLYLGAEWEPSPYFSVAVAWIGRRVTRLAQGAVLGGPTLDDSVPTTQGFTGGLGVVFNVSPDFFRLATQKNGSFFK